METKKKKANGSIASELRNNWKFRARQPPTGRVSQNETESEDTCHGALESMRTKRRLSLRVCRGPDDKHLGEHAAQHSKDWRDLVS